MTLFVKLNDGVADGYCITESNLKQIFPNENIHNEDVLSSLGYAKVYEVTIPHTDNPSKQWEEITPELDEDGNYNQTYSLVDREASEEEITAAKKSLLAEKLNIVNSRFKELTSRPIIATSLGFSVDGGSQDLNNFKSGKSQGLLVIRDSENAEQTLSSLDDYDLIISAIEAENIRLMNKKWELKNDLSSIDSTLDYEDYKTALEGVDISHSQFES